ncbi:MAG: hypothetical protein LKJ69_01660 [Lactobacillus sp.]|nr:hypothetical protein [Lactobacillus sp.]MCI2032090.1 hypothetical protein [Lactobacillus sp.]
MKINDLTPTEAAVIGLMRRGASVDLTMTRGDTLPKTNAEARDWLKPLSEAIGAPVVRAKYTTVQWWKTFNGHFTAAVFVAGRRPDHDA